MPPSFRLPFFVIVGIWSAAIAFRTIRSVSSGEPYVIAFWEGGMLSAGKQITKTGVRLKLVSSILSLIGIGLFFVGLLPLPEGLWALVVVLSLHMVADFGMREPS